MQACSSGDPSKSLPANIKVRSTAGPSCAVRIFTRAPVYPDLSFPISFLTGWASWSARVRLSRSSTQQEVEKGTNLDSLSNPPLQYHSRPDCRRLANRA